MDDPITWRIAQAIQAQIQLIRTPAFFTDIGANVVLEDVQSNQQDAPHTYIDTPTWKPSNKDGAPKNQRQIDFLIEAVVKAEIETSNFVSHCVWADVEAAFKLPVVQSIQNVRGYSVSQGQIVTRPAGMASIAVQVSGYAIYMP